MDMSFLDQGAERGSNGSMPPLLTVRIQEIGPIRDLSLRLTALHALIGPNDSGKSTILRALLGLAQQCNNRTKSSHVYSMKDAESRQPEQITLRAGNVRSPKLSGAEPDGPERLWVPAQAMSEGLLYYLAFAALPYLSPTSILLVEEPENGLHPARIREVMRILRELSQTTRVVIATHSPLVVNELQGDEVSVITRDPVRGSEARLLAETPNFAARSKVYALGELWVSYADGDMEEPLFLPSVAAEP